MVNKNYQRGRAFEYRVKKYLEKKGYFVVRSAGSKSPFDLVAIPLFSSEQGKEVLLVQCKYGAKISKKERDNLKILRYKLSICTMIQVAWAKPNRPITFQNITGII